MTPLLADSTPRLMIAPRRIVIALAVSVAFLTVMNLVQVYISNYTAHAGNEILTLIIQFFRTDDEWNLPAYFSAGILLLASLLLAIVAMGVMHTKQAGSLYWAGLSVIFCYMAFDEFFRIHERLNSIVPQALQSVGIRPPGWIKWMWVIPGALFVLAVGAIYLRFVFRLPKRTRLLFIVSGATFVTGALGMEFVAMVLLRKQAEPTIWVHLASGLEECLEMTGVVLFIHGILDYLSTAFPTWQLTIGNQSHIEPVPPTILPASRAA